MHGLCFGIVVPQLCEKWRIRTMMHRGIYIVCLALLLGGAALGQALNVSALRGNALFMRYIHSLELKTMAKPAWAEATETPRMRVGWVSDMHIGCARGWDKRAQDAFAFMRDVAKVDWVLITGDTNATCRKGKEPEAVRRHLYTKDFLSTTLRLPYVMVPGDNWPQGYEEVFGTRNRSYDCLGFHFVLLGADIRARGGNDACAVFTDETKRWIESDIAAHAGQPCFLVLHESVLPPCFLDAPFITKIGRMPNVVAVLSGHLHLDLDFQEGAVRQLVCPGLGPSVIPAFKVMDFYDDKVILRNVELQAGTGTFEWVDKWQKIDIPPSLRRTNPQWNGAGACREAGAMPASAVVFDKSLLKRAPEIEGLLKRFMLRNSGRLLGGK